MVGIRLSDGALFVAIRKRGADKVSVRYVASGTEEELPEGFRKEFFRKAGRRNGFSLPPRASPV